MDSKWAPLRGRGTVKNDKQKFKAEECQSFVKQFICISELFYMVFKTKQQKDTEIE